MIFEKLIYFEKKKEKILPMLKENLTDVTMATVMFGQRSKKSFQKKTILLCFKMKTKRPFGPP